MPGDQFKFDDRNFKLESLKGKMEENRTMKDELESVEHDLCNWLLSLTIMVGILVVALVFLAVRLVVNDRRVEQKTRENANGMEMMRQEQSKMGERQDEMGRQQEEMNREQTRMNEQRETTQSTMEARESTAGGRRVVR